MDYEIKTPVCLIIIRKDETLAQFVEDYDFYYSGVKYRIPAGFVCNGASIPRVFWACLGHPFDAELYSSAVVHDYCYDSACIRRAQADKLFRVRMKSCGVRFFKRWIIWLAVRLFGKSAYNYKPQN